MDYVRGPSRSVPLRWPGGLATAVATFEDRGGPRPVESIQGPWAWFRMVDAGPDPARSDTGVVLEFQGSGHRSAWRSRPTACATRSASATGSSSPAGHDSELRARAYGVGFYGKLPSHGDFLRRRVSDAFVAAWDAWLQHCMAASRAALGDRWLDVYLTSPVWRFACAPGVAGAAPVVGVMAPSVDRVGRYFPLTHRGAAARRRQPGARPRSTPSRSSSAPSTRARDPRGRAASTSSSSTPTSPASATELGRAEPAAGRRARGRRGRAARRRADDRVADADASPPSWRSHAAAAAVAPLSARYAPLTLWWTEGSARVEPSCLIVKGLPPPDAFAAMLDGSWARQRWAIAAGARRAVARSRDHAILDGRRRRSATGRPRKPTSAGPAGQPGRLPRAARDRPLGGRRRPGRAHRRRGREPDGVRRAGRPRAGRRRFEETADGVERTAQRGQRPPGAHRRTVAARPTCAAARSSSCSCAAPGCAVLWAGDSRVYRWRDGRSSS